MRSHGVAAAMYPFYKVITSVNSSEDRGIKALGLRCLLPGLYAQNLERWLKYFSPSQVSSHLNVTCPCERRDTCWTHT